MSRLPPFSMLPTTYLHTPLALLIRRPVCCLTLYALERVSGVTTKRGVEDVVIRIIGADVARWALRELIGRQLVSAEYHITGEGLRALRKFEETGFSEPPYDWPSPPDEWAG